jgi:dihydrofolate reductase
METVKTDTRKVSIIVAMARGRVIGVRNTLPWHLPEDLKHFKALTLGHHIIMGRKTYESIGRPLPGRTTVIVSRDRDYRVPGCLSAPSIEAALESCGNDPEIFFVGGANLYAQALPLATRLYLTEIDLEVEGDAWFPEFERACWTETARDCRATEAGLAYCFLTLDRRPMLTQSGRS